MSALAILIALDEFLDCNRAAGVCDGHARDRQRCSAQRFERSGVDDPARSVEREAWRTLFRRRLDNAGIVDRQRAVADDPDAFDREAQVYRQRLAVALHNGGAAIGWVLDHYQIAYARQRCRSRQVKVAVLTTAGI